MRVDDEVRRLLTDFADRTVADGFDVDDDVARGRRALRRGRRSGALLAAGVVAAVALTAGILVDRLSGSTSTLYADQPEVMLAETPGSWGGISCKLSPSGWRVVAQKTGYAALTAPGSSGQLVLRTASKADNIEAGTAVREPGRIVRLGWYAEGDRVAQTKLGDTWLIVRLPPDAQGWNDTVLLRFVDSCTVR